MNVIIFPGVITRLRAVINFMSEPLQSEGHLCQNSHLSDWRAIFHFYSFLVAGDIKAE